MPESTRSITSRRVIEVLTPSALSSVLCLVSGLVLSIGAILINRFNTSSLDVEYKYYQSHRVVSSNQLGGSLLQNTFIKDLPLLLFWSLVGVLVYLVAVDIIKAFSSAIELRKELDYVHAQKKSLVDNFVLQIVVRLVVLAVWLPYLIFFFHHLIPYCLRIAIMATSASQVLHIVGDVLLAVVVSTLAIHVNLILLRLLFLKPRLFTNILD